MNERHEIKFVIPWEYHKTIYHKIKTNHGHFNKIYKPRFVNNIYFDNLDLRNYFENINGNSKRKKIRIRWYDNFFGKIISPVIEIKEKRGMVVNKTSIPIQSFFIKPNMSVRNISKSLDKNFVFIRFLRATIINRYKREYFLSNDKKFRLTIDTNQCFTNPRNISFQQKLFNTEPEPMIVELKYNLQWEKEARYITNLLGLRINKNSKYVNSINAQYKYIL